jgi:aspartate 1-decarboxylase
MSMLVTMLKAKLRRATVTGADMDYEGSIGIDRDLLDPPASCRTSRSTS